MSKTKAPANKPKSLASPAVPVITPVVPVIANSTTAHTDVNLVARPKMRAIALRVSRIVKK